MNVLLVLPNVYLGNRIGDHESKEPLGLLYLVAVLRSKGYEASVLQADYYGLSVEQTVDVVLFQNPAIVGFSVTQRAAPSVLKTVELLRKSGFTGHITSGGYLPSLCTEDFLNRATEIDSVVVGEGEETFLELVECLNYGRHWNCVSGLAYRKGTSVIINQPRPLIRDLDTLTFPSRDLLTDAFGRMGYASLISSRGCYGNCTFCPQNAFKCKNPGPRWRGRSPENVVDEMESINRDYNIGMFKFNDDNIFGPGETGRERVIGICEEIIRRGVKVSLMAYCRINDIEHEVMALMRKAGFERLLVGIESTIPTILCEYKKEISPIQIREKLTLLEELGFSVIPGFMMFNPYSSLGQLETDLEFLRTTKSFGVSISKTLKIHDSTEIKNQLLACGRLKLVPFEEGYHEYTIDNGVARVFKSLKLIWSRIIDPMQANCQDLVARLKKSTSFNTRQEYDEYLRLIWEIQADIMVRLINWVRADRVDRVEIKDLLKEVQSRMNQVIVYLKARETSKVSRARQFRLYPFCKNNISYCLDLVSSRIFPVDSNLLRGLRIMISEQSTENLEPAVVNQVKTLERKGLIQPLESSIIKSFDGEKVAELVTEVLQDHDLSTMTERYFWEE